MRTSPNTTQAEMIEDLEAAVVRSPGNQAIVNHLNKVRKLSAEQYPAHLAELIELGNAFTRSGAADMMMADMMKQMKRGR